MPWTASFTPCLNWAQELVSCDPVEVASAGVDSATGVEASAGAVAGASSARAATVSPRTRGARQRYRRTMYDLHGAWAQMIPRPGPRGAGEVGSAGPRAP